MPNRAYPILYIDDDVALGRLVQRVLGRRGFVVEHVAEIESGVARIRQGGIHVLILDHDLGTTSGLEVLDRLRDCPNRPAVVYVTANSEITVAVQALKAGADDYVVKTVGEDFEILLASAVEQAIEKTKLTRAKEAAERELREAHERAVMLLAEVNHRVANSLALVSSLVRMQSSAVQDPAAKSALAETQARIAAIANLHRSLYTSDDVRTVDLGVYLGELVADLGHSMSASGQTPEIKVDVASLQIKTDKAVSLGMIVTELVTNAMKYAYPDGVGEVRIRLERADESDYALAVEDDGIGWSGDGPIKGSGLGSKIITAMARSLSTAIRYASVKRGTRIVVPIGAELLAEDV